MMQHDSPQLHIGVSECVCVCVCARARRCMCIFVMIHACVLWAHSLAQEDHDLLASYSPLETLPSAVARAAQQAACAWREGRLASSVQLTRQQKEGAQHAQHESGAQHAAQQRGGVEGSGCFPAFPHLLITAGLHDPRVPFWGPAM